MSPEDILYLLMLLFSIPFGHVVKSCGSNAWLKRVLAIGFGLFIGTLLIGSDVWHSLVVIMGTSVIIKSVGPRYCHYVSFIFVFGYLFFFRICGSLGFKQPVNYANALQLLVTLRMVSVAFEFHDFEKEKNHDSDNRKNYRVKPDITFSLIDIIGYGYCYIGILTGPFYTYQTFTDMLYQDATSFTTVWPAMRNLKLLPLFVVPYLYLSKNYPLSYIESEACLNHEWGILYQLWILVPTFTWFRWRFYIAWLLAEAMCITAGLGAYPFECKSRPGKGPTEPIPKDYDLAKAADEHNGDTHDFETTHNIVVQGVEFSPTMKSTMKEWNMTVQWWMATYVYKKLPFKSNQMKMFLLLFVSAFWHGVHPGYYLTFLSVPMVVIAETRMTKAVKPYLSESLRYWWDWVTWFCLYRSFEYLGVGFMLLRLESIWKVWTRMYFIGHLLILFFVILPIFIPRKRTVAEDEKDQLKTN